MKKIKIFHLGIIVLFSVLLALFNPLKMELNQAILFSALIFTLATWATSAIHKSLSCLFFLVMAGIFGKTEPLSIVSYLWSDMNLLIMATTLLSVGIMKTGLIHRYVDGLFRRSSNSMLKLLLLPYLFGILLIFIIPQAFARVIIMGTIFTSLLLERTPEEKRAKQALIFNVFMGVSVVYMLLSNGEIVINVAAVKFGGEAVGEALDFMNWFKLMFLPTVITSLATLGMTYLVFRRELSCFSVDMIAASSSGNEEVSKLRQGLVLAIMLVIIAFWMTGSFHPVPAWLVSMIGVGLMLALSVLDFKDFKAVNPHFILFLMTIFSIGKILGQSGISAVLFDQLKLIIPAEGSGFYLAALILVVMLMHMIIGSAVATMSVVLPLIVPLSQELGYRPEIITLMTYVLTNIHFLLPFHQANVMIGTARDYYPASYMLRFGAYMTVLVPLLLALVYFPWWKLLGLL